MTVSVLSAAKRLAARSGWTLSNLELQKILYLAHMVHLGRTDGAPLVHGLFEAWDYGPVHPDLYHRVKIFGSSPVKNIFQSYADLPESLEREIIDEAYVKLGKLGSGQLVHITHRPGGAWETNYQPNQRGCFILNSDILKEYLGLANVSV